jgi:hypothetical protein
MNSDELANNGNYDAFHRKKNKAKKRYENNKTINIYNFNDRNQNNNNSGRHSPKHNTRKSPNHDNMPPLVNEENMNKERIAQDLINRFSLNKPVVTINNDRYSPVIGKSNNGSPVNFPEDTKTIQFIHVVRPPLEKEQKLESEKETKEEINESFEEITFTDEIKHISDLITLSGKYIIKPNVKYSIDLPKLNKIVPHLQELNNMIGMEDIKTSLTYQLMYFLQGFEFKHMLHTIIEGPPGVGKHVWVKF